jgi:hypothetical protein
LLHIHCHNPPSCRDGIGKKEPVEELPGELHHPAGAVW